MLNCVIVLATSVFSGCGKSNKSIATDPGAPYDVTVMLPALLGDSVTDDSPSKKALEKYTNANIKFNWVPGTSYDDKLNVALAADDLPNVVYVSSKSASVLSAVKAGAFWEIGPYLKDYSNLSKASPTVLDNSSIGGKTYGLYRARPYGRNGIIYRKDWAESLGIAEPKTIDDFYKMIKAFTTQDPDKNGKNDTYGVSLMNNLQAVDITSTWFGASNQWGKDKDGKLVPTALTSEYVDNLKFWKKLYDEGLINKNFAVINPDPVKLRNELITGKAGVMLGTIDDASKILTGMLQTDPDAAGKIDVMGEVSGPQGLKNLPTSGYNGMYLFSKNANKTEADIKKLLEFMNKTNDKEAQTLIELGVEGRQYDIKDGVVVAPANKDIPKTEHNDLAQFGTIGVNIISGAYAPSLSGLIKKIQSTMTQNEKYCVANPAEPLQSATYMRSGAQLDNIIKDARTKFIVGQINEDGLKSAQELWLKSGGDKIINEINEQYKLINQNK